mgnify:CR=1 FL=1
MKLEPECILCQIKVREEELLTLLEDKRKVLEALSNILRLLIDGIEKNLPINQIATYAFRHVKKITNCEDPYKEYKEKTNSIAEKLSAKIEIELEKLKDPVKRFRRTCIIATLSNAIDPGVAGHTFKEKELVERLLHEEPYIDDTQKLLQHVKNSKNILYLADNSGEIFFDKILIKELKKCGTKVTFVVKSGPFQNDVTLEDTLNASIDKVADEVITTGSDAAGVIMEECSKEFLEKLEEADLIIAKGLANYESLTEYTNIIKKPIAYFLVAKCEPIARSLKAKKGTSIIKLHQYSKY